MIELNITLSEQGYARLSNLANQLAGLPGLEKFDIGDAVHLVLETGTELIEQRLRQEGQGRAGILRAARERPH